MRVVFFGTSKFAVPSVRAICSHYEVPFIVTSKGNSAVKKVAEELNIKFYQPESPDSIYDILKEVKPEIICVSAYGYILKKNILDIPQYPIGIHPSLLPKYRGAAPINWAIINGESLTGVTTFIMNEKYDAGQILLQKETFIKKGETKGELETRLSEIGAELILVTIKNLLEGTIIPKEQDKTQSSYAPKITKEMRKIDWNKSSTQVANLINGLSPVPSAYTTFRNRRIELLKATPTDIKGIPGEIIENKKELIIGCADGSIIVNELKPEGKNVMSGKDFINGYRPKMGEKVI